MKVNRASAGFGLLLSDSTMILHFINEIGKYMLSRSYWMIWVTKDILKRLNGVKKKCIFKATEAELTCFVLAMGKNPRFYTSHNATVN